MILTQDEVAELIGLMRAAGAMTVELARGGSSLRVTLPRAATAPAAPVAAPAPAAANVTVPATGTGRLMLRHPMAAAPLAPPGARVEAGDVLALLATGPLLRPVTAPRAGTILRVLQEDGAAIGHGTPLFEITPAKPSSAPDRRKTA